MTRPGEPNWNNLDSFAYPLRANHVQYYFRQGKAQVQYEGFKTKIVIGFISNGQMHIEYEYKGKVNNKILPMTSQQFKPSDKPRLVCPVLNTEVSTLYLSFGFIFSKAAYRKASLRKDIRKTWLREWALGTLQQTPLSTAKRVEALETLVDAGPGDNAEAEACLEAYREEKRVEARRRAAVLAASRRREARKGELSAARRRQRRLLDKQTLGVWAGIKGAKAAGLLTRPNCYRALGWDLTDLLSISSATRLPGRLRPLDAPLAAIEEFVRIDLRLLLREGKATLGKNTVEVLVWDGVPQGPGRLVVVGELKGRHIYMCFAWETLAGRFIQSVGIEVQTIGRRKRPWIICPVTGARVELLVFRNDRFASPIAQRLNYASQIARKRPV